MDRLMSVLRRFPGNVPVILHDPNTKRTQLAPKELFVNPSGAVKDVLCELLGQDNVKIKRENSFYEKDRSTYKRRRHAGHELGNSCRV